MPLDDQDLARITALLKQEVGAMEDRARSRRRFWLWFWTLAILLGAALSLWFTLRTVEALRARLGEQERAFLEAKREYQRELAASRRLQEERAAAERAVGYRSGQSQATYEASLIAGTLGMIGKANELQRRYEKAPLDDLDELEAFSKDYQALMNQALGSLGTMLLRNTDPAHNTGLERALQDAGGAGSATRSGPPLQP